MSTTTILATILGCVIVFDVGCRYLGSRETRLLPPSPPGLPWIGNVIGIDIHAPWLTCTAWSKKYGDLVYVRLLGRDIIIINSEAVAKDLLDNRSSNYSDRPYLITSELAGIGFNSALARYGDTWRLHRRFFHQTYRMEAIPRFLPLQHTKGCQLLRRLLDTPEKLEEHVFEYTSSLILNSVYDYDPISRKDHLIDMIARVLDIIVPAVRPDVAIIVGAFPLLLKLPSWLPGMAFKQRLATSRQCANEFVERPFECSMKKLLTVGSSSPSLMYDALQKVEEQGPESANTTRIKALKEAAATGILGASETSNSVILTFILMMIVTPEVQKKAQAQIDAVVGEGRLPTMEDRPMLPYVDAVIREVLRYSPVMPMSIPHATIDDDVYKGYHIPKGFMILANVWAMSRNEERFQNANEFIPERFLNEDGSLKPSDIDSIAYGFGRRICAGRHFADTSLWSVCSKVLAVFNVLPPKDENGIEIKVEPKFTTGIAIHPTPFRCRIEPRIPGLHAAGLEQLISGSTL